tara:strand:- start:244 stop:381 length:138 start_codon:yes stop_codon:yes gene_type:complete
MASNEALEVLEVSEQEIRNTQENKNRKIKIENFFTITSLNINIKK